MCTKKFLSCFEKNKRYIIFIKSIELLNRYIFIYKTYEIVLVNSPIFRNLVRTNFITKKHFEVTGLVTLNILNHFILDIFMVKYNQFSLIRVVIRMICLQDLRNYRNTKIPKVQKSMSGPKKKVPCVETFKNFILFCSAIFI